MEDKEESKNIEKILKVLRIIFIILIVLALIDDVRILIIDGVSKKVVLDCIKAIIAIPFFYYLFSVDKNWHVRGLLGIGIVICDVIIRFLL